MKIKLTILAVVAVANIIGAFFVLAPALLTYAEIPPPGITCSQCSEPEVQAALTAAATYGRATILRQMNSTANWVIGLVVFNILAVGVILFWYGSSNKALKEGPRVPRGPLA